MRDVKVLLVSLFILATPIILLNIHIEFLILWFSGLIMAQFYLRLHGYSEHTGGLAESEFDITITHEYNLIIRFFLYPINSHLHLEHHLYPTVPWYNLRKLRAEARLDAEYRTQSEQLTSDGYFFGEKSIVKLVFDLT